MGEVLKLRLCFLRGPSLQLFIIIIIIIHFYEY